MDKHVIAGCFPITLKFLVQSLIISPCSIPGISLFLKVLFINRGNQRNELGTMILVQFCIFFHNPGTNDLTAISMQLFWGGGALIFVSLESYYNKILLNIENIIMLSDLQLLSFNSKYMPSNAKCMELWSYSFSKINWILICTWELYGKRQQKYANIQKKKKK